MKDEKKVTERVNDVNGVRALTDEEFAQVTGGDAAILSFPQESLDFIDHIDPTDLSGVEIIVLKDASDTAIYGVKGET